ncbi:MAG: choice-of-anchor Q domain-containing protein, partial [Bacteroidota bacterium]
DLQNGYTNGNGGAISTESNLSLRDVRLIGNTAAQNGGAILNTASLTLAQVVFLDNQSGGNAGALHNQGGIVNATESWWKDNLTLGNGGAIWNTLSGEVRLYQSTLEGHQCDEGTIYNASGGFVLLENSTISNNIANAQGGALHNIGGRIEILFSTITQNQANDGGSFHQSGSGGIMLIANSILALNAATSFPEGFSSTSSIVGSGGGNVIGETSGFSWPGTPSDLVGTFSSPLDPLLDPLANNGGFAPTHRPQLLSPAVDNAVGSISIDQRGNSRSTGLPDAGSIELGATPFAVEWLDFQVSWHHSQTQSALLQWQVQQQGNSHHFVIERSLDGRLFQRVGEIPASPNAGLHSYEALDTSVLGEKTLYYRIKEVDLDGRYQLSEIRSLTQESGLISLQAWPNPANGPVQISRADTPDTPLPYQLLDARGSVLQAGKWPVGQIQLRLEDFGQLPAGLYHFQVYQLGKRYTISLIRP